MKFSKERNEKLFNFEKQEAAKKLMDFCQKKTLDTFESLDTQHRVGYHRVEHHHPTDIHSIHLNDVLTTKHHDSAFHLRRVK